MDLTYISLFSGIEAASVAWGPLGWIPVCFSEIEPFPCSVLTHHYPNTPNLGDVTKVQWSDWEGVADVVCGGSPCQDFSVAGLRNSMDGHRGNLTLTFVEACNAINPRFILWENVPGVLNTKDNAFGCFLAGLVGADNTIPAPILSKGSGRPKWPCSGVVSGPKRVVAWRTLDAQYFHLAQRRRRVFLLAANTGDRVHPGQVLFEPESLYRDTPPGQDQRQDTAPTLSARTKGGGRLGTDTDCDGGLIASTVDPLMANGGTGNKHGYGAGQQDAQSGYVIPVVFDETQITSRTNRCQPKPGDPCHPLVGEGRPLTLAYGGNNTTGPIDLATACRAKGGSGHGDFESETFVTHSLRADGFDASEDGTGRGTSIVATFQNTGHGWWNDDPVAQTIRDASAGGASHSNLVAFSCKDHGADAGELAPTLRSMGHDASHANAGGQVAVAFNLRGRDGGSQPEPTSLASLRSSSGGSSRSYVMGQGQPMAVRRLSVVECCHLMGFPDTYLHQVLTHTKFGKVKWHRIPVDESRYLRAHGITCVERKPGQWFTNCPADGVMYKALGNSWAVPCVRWIGERLEKVIRAVSTE